VIRPTPAPYTHFTPSRAWDPHIWERRLPAAHRYRRASAPLLRPCLLSSACRRRLLRSTPLSPWARGLPVEIPWHQPALAKLLLVRRAPLGGELVHIELPCSLPVKLPQGVELVPIVLPRGLPIELPCAPSCSPLSWSSSSSACFPRVALVRLLSRRSHALNGGATSNDRGEERNYPGKGGAASPRVFSTLSYGDRWTIYSDTPPRNLGVSTLFHRLLEIA
jgi:hypothetical protein